MVHPLQWQNGRVTFLDQTCLPHEQVFITTDDVAVIAEAIRSLRVRGAPLIGVAAAYGVALAARHHAGQPDLRTRVHNAIALLGATRPTAVNLFTALARIQRVIERCKDEDNLPDRVLQEAVLIEGEDVRACARIGEFGAALLPFGISVLTHCNAGALATAGIGTALGVITTAHAQGKIKRVYADETRPLLQGARLTAWELLQAGIETVLITDNTAGVVLSRGMVQAVIVGADRIAANGDTANKVGTYPLAVLAARHHVPFYVAAPLSTVDVATPRGADIVIEERNADEVTHIGGARLSPDGVKAFSPAFDVTPNELITAIVTNEGVCVPPFNEGLGGLFGHH